MKINLTCLSVSYFNIKLYNIAKIYRYILYIEKLIKHVQVFQPRNWKLYSNLSYDILKIFLKKNS